MASASKRQQWQAHVDDALLRTGQVQRVAIFGLDGKEWATSSGFQVSSNHKYCLCALLQYNECNFDITKTLLLMLQYTMCHLLV